MARRNFSPEFKAEAVKLVVEQGYTLSDACKAMDVGGTALRRWVKQWKEEHEGIAPSAQALTSEQRRIQELEAKVSQLERERDLLKRSTAFFVKELDRSTR